MSHYYNILLRIATIGIFATNIQDERVQYHGCSHQQPQNNKIGSQPFFGQGQLRV